MKKIILITGGMRSGKSRYALELASKTKRGQASAGSLAPCCFIATAEPLDEEMRLRIAKHREERGKGFFTVEEPLALGAALERVKGEFEVVLIDCLTLWVNNLFHYYKEDSKIHAAIEHFLKMVSQYPSRLIFVTNEVGLGLASENPLARRYADELGRLNQQLALLCDEVVFMVSGIPQILKTKKTRMTRGSAYERAATFENQSD